MEIAATACWDLVIIVKIFGWEIEKNSQIIENEDAFLFIL
jgi:hypothetical protein